MIVVAIIGILAAIAIPAYQNYIARSQATEAVNLLAGLKTRVVDIAGTSGITTACSTDAAVKEVKDSSGNITTAAKLAGALAEENGFTLNGKYVEKITAKPVGTDACDFTAQFRAAGNGLNDKIAGKTVTFNGFVAQRFKS